MPPHTQRIPVYDPTRLTLEGCTDVTDEAVIYLARSYDWPRLERLNLHLCTEITDHSLCALAQSAQLSHLVELNIGGCLLVTDQGIAELVQGQREWHGLDLSNLTQITDAAVGFIADAENCLSLERLRLFGSHQLTDQALYALSKSSFLRNLRELDLGGGLFQLSEQGIISLAEIKSLETLSLRECPGVTDKAISFLATLPELRQLDITDCPAVSLEGLQPVAHLELKVDEIDWFN